MSNSAAAIKALAKTVIWIIAEAQSPTITRWWTLQTSAIICSSCYDQSLGWHRDSGAAHKKASSKKRNEHCAPYFRLVFEHDIPPLKFSTIFRINYNTTKCEPSEYEIKLIHSAFPSSIRVSAQYIIVSLRNPLWAYQHWIHKRKNYRNQKA